MRKLMYELSNGTTVSTMAEARKSGLNYTVIFEEIVPPSSPMSEKQRARRKAIR